MRMIMFLTAEIRIDLVEGRELKPNPASSPSATGPGSIADWEQKNELRCIILGIA